MSEHSKRKHSKFAASAAKRWLNCPGSIRLTEKAPPQIESVYAKEGTEAHECLEYIVRRFKNFRAAVKDCERKYPGEMVDHAITSAELIFDLRPSKNASLLVEQRVTLNHIKNGMFGTLDYAWIDDWGDLVVIDFKYGYNRVLPIEDGEPNPQLMYYALGLLKKHGDGFGSAKLAIIQPRVYSDGERPVASADVAISKIYDFENKIRSAVKIANRPDAPLKAGDWCKYCPAAAICPENSQNQMNAADIVFDIDEGIIANPEPLALTPQNLPKLLKAADQLEIWIKAVREHAYRVADGGETIPGYKLVAKRAQRVWNPGAEENALRIFEPDEIYEIKFVSPAQLEKKFKTLGKEFTEKFTSSVSSGFNLVPESDKRPEVKNTVSFDLIGE